MELGKKQQEWVEALEADQDFYTGDQRSILGEVWLNDMKATEQQIAKYLRENSDRVFREPV